MAVDTASKRASSMQVLLPWVVAPPIPDGAISQGDRQHVAWSYAGILAAEAAVEATPRVEGYRFRSIYDRALDGTAKTYDRLSVRKRRRGY